MEDIKESSPDKNNMHKSPAADITILCKVVDNFGDIGVVYRLAKALNCMYQTHPEIPEISLRIIVDNLKSFNLLCPEIDPQKQVQTVKGWQIFQWDSPECFEYFQKKQPKIILECFQCGRPEWLDKLLFEVKVPETVHIVMIDYLTAEDYAETFHKLQSLTRSAKVQKINFMPGFTSKTGGLIISDQESETVPAKIKSTPEKFNAVFFSYPRNQKPVLNALKAFNSKILNGSLNIQLAKGAGFESFYSEWQNFSTEKPFSLQPLDFLPQEKWDLLLQTTPLLFIRGEDSLSRACLYGHPFIWHAYPQSEDYQLVKVQALLEKLRPFFSEADFKILENAWQIYNGKPGNLEQALTDFLLIFENLREGFYNFSQSLKKNGDLAFNLMTFIFKTYIIRTLN